MGVLVMEECLPGFCAAGDVPSCRVVNVTQTA